MDLAAKDWSPYSEAKITWVKPIEQQDNEALLGAIYKESILSVSFNF